MSKKITFTRDDRKRIAEAIENLKNDTDYVEILDILINNESNDIVCTQNSNGIFLNLSAASDATLDEIRKYLDKKSKIQKIKPDNEMDIIPGSNHTKPNRAYKLSNYEQNILKHREIMKTMENESEYKELQITSKKTPRKKPANKKNNIEKN